MKKFSSLQNRSIILRLLSYWMKYFKVPSCKPDSTDVWTRCFFSLCTLKASLSEWDKSFNFLFDNDVFSTSFCSSEFIKQEVKTCFCCGCWKCQLKKNKVCEDKEGMKLQWMLEDVLWSVDLSRFSQTCCWWWWRWWSLSADSWLVLSGLVWLSDVSCYSSVWLKTTNGSLIHRLSSESSADVNEQRAVGSSEETLSEFYWKRRTGRLQDRPALLYINTENIRAR